MNTGREKQSNNERERILNEFASKQWSKVLAFLRGHYGLNEEESKDIFQEAFIVFYTKNANGETSNISSSLSTFFFGICKNKAREYLRDKGKRVNVDEDSTLDSIRQDKAEALLDAFDDCDSKTKDEQEELVRKIVEELPSPCNELLWGFFRDNFSMKTLAEMLGYSNENVAKVTKHRCQNKFHEKYNSLREQLYS